MRRQTRSSAAVALACAAVLALGACDDGTPTSADESSTSEPTASSAHPTTPTETTEPTTPGETVKTETSEPPTPKPPMDDSTAERARQTQIKPADFPGFNDQWQWDAATGSPGEGQRNQSICLHTDLVAIGGVNEYSTTLKSSADGAAVAYQLTAVFPDEHTAMTAETVLDNWQTRCQSYARSEKNLKHVDVSAVRDVPTVVGAGKQWMVTYRPVPNDPDSVWFNAEGFVRDGDVITYLVIRNAGQDYNYEVGQEPMDLAVAVAGDYLKKTR